MLVRQALFEGAIHPGQDAAFDAYVAATMMPLWRRFPGVREVRVLRERARDAGMPEVAMVLSMAFDDAEALAAALESPVRHESREATQGLLALFDGRVRHHVFELAHADG